jgi:hypothetical protein
MSLLSSFFKLLYASVSPSLFPILDEKSSMLQLISEKWIYALKLLLVVPLFVYAYAIIALNEVFALDLVGFGLTLLGTFTVVKSKFDLSRHHT